MIRVNMTATINLAIAAITAAGMTLALSTTVAADNTDSYYMRTNYNLENGMKALQAGELSKASELFQKAAAGNLKKAHKTAVWNNICAIEHTLGALDKAEEACEQAVKVDRYNWRAWVNSGHVARDQGEYKLARKHYKRAVMLGGDKGITRDAFAALNKVTSQMLASAETVK